MTTATFSNPTPSYAVAARAIARHTLTVERVLLGATFFVCGLNGFFDFLPHPKAAGSEAAMAFAGAMLKTGYFIPLLKGVETLCGALLLTKRFVPLSLVLLAPVIVNIFAFHAFLAPEGVVLASVLVVLEAHLAWSRRDAFRSVVAA